MPTKIFFIRHAEVHNPHQIWYGHLPRMKLSRHGLKQAAAAADFLQPYQFSSIYSSPLLRTRQTASIISAKLKLDKLSLSKKIIEIRSHLQGVPFSYVKKINGDFFSPEISQPGDESLNDILTRMVQFCQLINRRHPHQNILAVSHGDPLMILQSKINLNQVSLQSIRPGREKYIKHTEILETLIEDGQPKKIKTIYLPA